MLSSPGKSRKRAKKVHSDTLRLKSRGGAVLGHGRYGCVVKPAPRCKTRNATNRTKTVGKWVTRMTQRSPDREIRTLYSILDSPYFQELQRKYDTELKKAEEIRTRVGPEADILFVLPTHDCTKDNIEMSAEETTDYATCQTYIQEPLDILLEMSAAKQDLAAIMKISSANTSETIKILQQFTTVLRGLNVLHKHRIIHFDIRAENILQSDTALHLADFGISFLFPTYEEALETARTARSSSSSNSSFSSAPLLFGSRTPPMTNRPLGISGMPMLITKPGIPKLSLSLAEGAASPRLTNTYNVMARRDFDEMKKADIAAIWDVMQQLIQWAGPLIQTKASEFLTGRYSPFTSVDILQNYQMFLKSL